jgi:methylated-DNA-[protein]-cysteine S-methyltransferase
MNWTLSDVPSPLGNILLVTDGEAVRALDFSTHQSRMEELVARYYGPVELVPGRDRTGTTAKLKKYFAGDWHALDDIPVSMQGTDFQLQVWQALRKIPPGKTKSYGEMAQAIGKPKACRAVGLANGANPIAIIVPCHRVIGANATLTGYGGGLDRKQWLLKHEGITTIRFDV